MYRLGKRSEKELSRISIYLQIWVREFISVSYVDFGILKLGGLRTAKEQKSIFEKGNSMCDGFKKKSYHQTGLAVDLVPYVNNKFTWKDKEAFIKIINKGLEVWEKLQKENKIPMALKLHSGGFWRWKDINENGVLDKDDMLGWDSAHWELRDEDQNI